MSYLHFELAFPVRYSVERPTIDVFNFDESDLLEDLLLRKADFRSYEQK